MRFKNLLLIIITSGLLFCNYGCGSGSSQFAGTETGHPRPKAGIIRGRLTYTGSSGSPSLAIKKGLDKSKVISNIKVRVENSVLSAYSDTEGIFEISNVLSGTHTIIAEYSDEIKVRIDNIIMDDSGGKYLESVNMEEAGCISGIIKLKDAAEHSGIRVGIEGTGLTGITDKNGYFLIEGIPETVNNGNSKSENYRLIFWKAGYESHGINNIRIVPGKTVFIDTSIILNPTENTYEITGQVILEDTTDYSGVLVMVKDMVYSDTTDVTGTFRIKGVPPASYKIEAQKSGYLTVVTGYFPVGEETEFSRKIYLNKTGRVDSDGDGIQDDIDTDNDNDGFSDMLELAEGTERYNPFSYPVGRVKGYIIPSVSGAVVYAKMDGITQGIALTKSNGSYLIEDIPAGIYTITASASGYSETEIENISVTGENIVTVSDIYLSPASSSGDITGTALLSGQADHSEIRVTVQSADYQTSASSSGDFMFSGLKEYFYNLVLTCPGYIEKIIYDVIVRENETTVLPEITLKPVQNIGGTLTGTISLNDTDNYKGITVTLADRAAVTDSSGSFTITDISEGSYTVTASKQNYTGVTSLVNIVSEQVTNKDFELTSVILNDLDNDGIYDHLDLDKDGDGVLNIYDVFPSDATEWSDIDGDGIGDNADTDMDNDGYMDDADSFPKDRTEWFDTDKDGIGDNADLDDDGDSYTDIEEEVCGTYSDDKNSKPSKVLSVSAEKITVNKNYIFEVKIYVKDVEKVSGAKLIINYDPEKVSVLNDKPGPFLSMNGGEVIYWEKPSGTSYLNRSLSVLGGSPAYVTGFGVIAVIKFKALETAESTSISLTGSVIRSYPDNQDINVKIVDLNVEIE